MSDTVNSNLEFTLLLVNHTEKETVISNTVLCRYISGTTVVVLLLCFSGTFYTGANYCLDKDAIGNSDHIYVTQNDR
jgi:hypothetical protein